MSGPHNAPSRGALLLLEVQEHLARLRTMINNARPRIELIDKLNAAVRLLHDLQGGQMESGDLPF